MIASTRQPALAAARRLLAFGAGAGIEIGERDLRIAVSSVRPSGARILGTLEIRNFRDQPAAEWGAVYSKFLAKLGASHVAAVAVLPRPQVTVRCVPMPGVAPQDMEAALALQIDSLHPYPEDDVMWGWSPAGAASALTGIARRASIEEYTALFAEAGVKLAAVTFSAAALYGASRLIHPPPAEGFLALAAGDEIEAYGESPARGVFSALLDGSRDRAAALALSELRLGDIRTTGFDALLPRPQAAPNDLDLEPWSLAYAASLAGACPRLALAVNLLPAEQRQSSSRAMFIPTAALALIVAGLASTLALSGAIEDHRYREALDAQIRQLQRQAAEVRSLDSKIASANSRLQALDDFRTRSRDDLDALAELTRMLAPPAWLRGLDLNRGEIDISGDTPQAAAMVKLLDSSPRFHNSEFTTPLARIGSMETFRIRSYRREPSR